MTLLVGIVCEGGIIVSSETQLTFGDKKRLDGEKIHEIDFSGTPLVIAESGQAAVSSEVIDLIKQKAKTFQIKDGDSISNAVEECVREVYNGIKTHFSLTDSDPLKFYKILTEEKNFELVFAYYFEQIPYLCRISLDRPIKHRISSKFEVAGSGANQNPFINLAVEKLISKSKTSLFSGLFYSVCTIRQAINEDTHCGGKIKCFVLKPKIHSEQSEFSKECFCCPESTILRIEKVLPEFLSGLEAFIKRGFDKEVEKYAEDHVSALQNSFDEYSKNPNIKA